MRNGLRLALGVALLAACGIPKDKYEAKEAEAQKYLKQYQDESAKAADLGTKVADLEKGNAALRAQLADAQKQLAETAQAKARLEQEKQAMQAQYEQLTAGLKSQIEAGNVQVEQLRGKMLVRMSEKILFRSGSARINKDGQAALDQVAKSFQTLTGKSIVVSGFTDNVPVNSATTGFASNWELSTARALSVVRYLQSKGVDPRMLGAAGFGEYHPVATNDTPEGRQQNRRIEIVLAPVDAVLQ
ncbi:MAG TPA: OmpA family protein [Anaeromyxobacteraceae bacterium]|nr:OmpA family protein [Anaeromyxobacteraceae bacterium]